MCGESLGGSLAVRAKEEVEAGSLLFPTLGRVSPEQLYTVLGERGAECLFLGVGLSYGAGAGELNEASCSLTPAPLRRGLWAQEGQSAASPGSGCAPALIPQMQIPRVTFPAAQSPPPGCVRATPSAGSTGQGPTSGSPTSTTSCSPS